MTTVNRPTNPVGSQRYRLLLIRITDIVNSNCVTRTSTRSSSSMASTAPSPTARFQATVSTNITSRQSDSSLTHPSEQIDVALNSALASSPLASPSPKLSQEGRHLVEDLKEVIRQAKYLLLTKNEGNLIQDFIWQTQHLDGGNASLPGAPIDKATAQQHGNQALDGLRTLGTLIISNGQFRKLLNDAQILLRDMAGDAAQKTANKNRTG